MVIVNEMEALSDLAQRIVERTVLEACAVDDVLKLPHNLTNKSPRRCCRHPRSCYLESIFEGLRDDEPLLTIEMHMIPVEG